MNTTLPHNHADFDPCWWLPSGHSQTLWRKFRSPVSVMQWRQRIELPDGDFIDLDWAKPSKDDAYTDGEKATDDAPIVFILHGLCGCSRSTYVLSLQKVLSEAGIPSVAMNFRGSGGTVNRFARAYHSGVSDDLEVVMQLLAKEYPTRAFSFVGYSLGANVLLKWLGERSSKNKSENASNNGDTKSTPPLNIAKAVAVSTPFTLKLCSQSMLSGFSRVYGRYFLNILTKELRAKKQHFEEVGNSDELDKLDSLGDMSALRTLWDFDNQITAPLHGFDDADDYYEKCSSIHFIPQIKEPTLLVQAANDPIIPLNALPSQKDLPKNVSMELHSNGGHVGFVSKNPNWLEQRIASFLCHS